MRNLAVFASGSGSNAENLYNHFLGSKSVKIDLILSENPNAFVLERAKKLKIDQWVFTLDQLRSGAVGDELKSRSIDFIVLAGFLKRIPDSLISMFPQRIVNIHPALLPKYGGKGMYGMHVHRSVIAAKEFESGITIHYVNERYDEGHIIFQAKCTVDKNDTAEDLAEKIHDLEYRYFPQIVEKVVTGIIP
ncbi:MAG: phosphoribosylglycinamide formyltransferase [Bacteroidales bacterium]|nr:phosphoribosylglycinamide formyltransferase [Tenuifilaceae bacterium]